MRQVPVSHEPRSTACTVWKVLGDPNKGRTPQLSLYEAQLQGTLKEAGGPTRRTVGTRGKVITSVNHGRWSWWPGDLAGRLG